MTTNNSEIANEKKLAEKISRPVRIDEKTNQGLTGHPSKDMPWKKYYPAEALDFDFPKMNIFDLVYEENRKRKDATALEYEGATINYGQFFEKVEERTELFKSLGVKENDIISVTMLMCPEFVYDWYALGRLNAITNLIDPRTSVDGIEKYLKEDGSNIILNTNIFLPKIIKAIRNNNYNIINYSLDESAKHMPFDLYLISKLLESYGKVVGMMDNRIIENKMLKTKAEHNLSASKYKENQALTIVHTGGTTGFPKGVVLSHDNYNAMAYEYKKSQIGFSPNDRFLLVMPPWISYGSGMLHMSLVTGMKAMIISKLESKKMANYLMDYKPQWFAGVPAHYKILLNSDLISKKGVPFLKAGAVGGDAMSPQLYEAINSYLLENGASQGVYPGYALTEVTSAFAVKQLGDYKNGSVGIPLPGGTVGIFRYDEISETTIDEELGYDEIGEICMQTPNKMLGYFKNQEQTDAVIRTHQDGKQWVHTGDLGHIDKDGFLFVDGRIKEMIIRHDGFKVYPSVIEKIINAHEEVSSCRVVGIEDTIHHQGEIPKAFIVLKDEYNAQAGAIIKKIQNDCNVSLPEYYVENMSFETIDKLPLTAIGKVDFQQLKSKQKILRK